MSCNGSENPCRTTILNTAACESLPSQIENFTKQFFGSVVKTEVNGVVSWSLPCNLDTGLPNNPRTVGEGLACYFLRLFDEGIIGLTGPQGNSGANGTAGRNAYTVTLAAFAQPSSGAPNTQVLTSYNPAILEGLNVFIDGSGWYVVTLNDPSGTLFLTLLQALPGAPAVIPAGRLVVPSGFQGASIVGPQGPQGPQGIQGPAGNTFTSTNGFYFAPVGTDYNLQVVYAPVNFVNSSPQVLLPEIGRYKINSSTDILGLGGVALTDAAVFKLRDVTTNGDVPGSEHEGSSFIPGGRDNIAIDAHYDTTQANTTIALYGRATTANVISAVALHTTLSFVRLS